MMRCYFHLVGPDESILDQDGIEVTCINAAKQYAAEVIAEQADDVILAGVGPEWMLRVYNEPGQLLFELPLT